MHANSPPLIPPVLPLRTAIKRKTLRVLDAAGRTFTRLKNRDAVEIDPASVHSVAIVDLLRIGDTIVCLPAVRAVRESFQNARLIVVCRSAIRELFEACSEVNEIIAPDTKRGKWRLIWETAQALRERKVGVTILLDRSPEGYFLACLSGARFRLAYGSILGVLCCNVVKEPPVTWDRPVWDYPPGVHGPHQLESWLNLVCRIGIGTKKKPYRLEIPSSAREKVRKMIEEFAHNTTKYVVVHPGSSPSYLWRGDRFARVAAWLKCEKGFEIVITGGPDDEPLATEIIEALAFDVLNLVGKLSLLELAAVIDEAQLVLTVDTCASHFASAMGTPSVVLFGPGDPSIWRPYGDQHAVVRNLRGACWGCKSPICFRGDHVCMNGIKVEHVIEVCERVLERSGS